MSDPFAAPVRMRSNVGPVFSAQFDSECDTCGGHICEDDDMRIVDGETQCSECIDDDEMKP